MKVIENLSVSAPTNLTVCGNFTFLMAMWSEGGCKCVWTLFLWHVCVADRPGWTLWSIDSVPGCSSRPQICILGFIPCPEGVLQAEGGSKLISLPARGLSLIGSPGLPPPASPPMRGENRSSVAWRAPDGVWRVAAAPSF